MFSGLYFSYDGELSKFYGIKILDFEGVGKFNTSILSTTVDTTKPARSPRFFRVGSHSESPPTFTLTVVSETALDDGERRRILSWMYNRSEFKKFQVYQPDLLSYYYKVIFNSVEAIYINGHCHGFSFGAICDSQYQYGEPSRLTLTQPDDGLGYEYYIYNYSDIPDMYVNPKITVGPGGGNFQIAEWDPVYRRRSGRDMIWNNIPSGTSLEIDCALKTCKATGSAYSFNNFSGYWTRLYKGMNMLYIVAPIGNTVTIECPNLALVGF